MTRYLLPTDTPNPRSTVKAIWIQFWIGYPLFPSTCLWYKTCTRTGVHFIPIPLKITVKGSHFVKWSRCFLHSSHKKPLRKNCDEWFPKGPASDSKIVLAVRWKQLNTIIQTEWVYLLRRGNGHSLNLQDTKAHSAESLKNVERDDSRVRKTNPCAS